MLLEKFYFGKMEIPTAFGSFHLIYLAIFVALATILILFFRKCSNKTFRCIVFIFWIILVLLEIGKQINFNYDYDNRTWLNYAWVSFPYQFCSLPLYLWPFVCFLPESKIKNELNIFLATYVFFGGFGYLFVPVSFCDRIFINHQTMLHHGIQVVISLFIFVHEYEKFNYKEFLKSSIFLVGSVVVAIILNMMLSPLGTINLFELNPLQPTQAVLFGDVLRATNYPIFLLFYLIGFFIMANVMYFIFTGSIKLCQLIKNKKANKNRVE